MNERDKILLLKIIDEAEYLLEKTGNSNLHEFIEDRDLQYIVTTALMKTGES
jgi:uncharacterized protein with HEPN domain